jgi:outer membrane protein TolC
MLLRITVVATFLVGASAFPASTVLVLDSAIEEGLRQSPQIQGSQAVVSEKRWKANEVMGENFLPKISISGTHFLDKRYSLTNVSFGAAPINFPGFYPTTQVSADAEMPLFSGFTGIARLQSAAMLEDVAAREHSRAQFVLSQEIRLAFFQALAARELQKVSEQNVKTLEDHLRTIKIQKRGGVATKYDALRVEVQLSEAVSDSVDTFDSAQMARRRLSVLLGTEADERPLDGSLPNPVPEVVTDLDTTTPFQRPDIEAMSIKALAAQRAESAQSRWLIPSVSLIGQFLVYNSQSMNNGAVSDTGVYRTAYNVGVRVHWNLFDGGVSFSQANASAAQAVQAERMAQAAKLQVPYDLAFWKRRYLANSQHYLAKRLDIARSEESVRLAKEEERAGTRTASEALDAILDLFKARAGMVNAQMNATEAQIRLELALGRRI